MRAVAIEYTPDGPRISRRVEVTDERADLQACLVNTVTSKTSDWVFSGLRGTEVLTTALQNGLLDDMLSQHVANFASTDALYFCLLGGTVEEGRLARVEIQAGVDARNRLLLRLTGIDAEDRQLAVSAAFPLT